MMRGKEGREVGREGGGVAGGLPCQLCSKPPAMSGIALSLLCHSSSAPPRPRQNDALRADGMCELPGERTSKRVEGAKGSAMKAASPKIKSKKGEERKVQSGGCECKKENVGGGGEEEEEGISSDCVPKYSGHASDAAEP